jgi:urocanate reductase
VNAALAGIGDGHNGGGPIWAIFDSAAAEREGWTTEPPHVDRAEGFFFSANTIPELASKIAMKYQRVPMPPAALEATVARYHGFVDSGIDSDFGKPRPAHKVLTPPFHAAWATLTPHDTRAGLRINAKCQVIDRAWNIIPGLYCGGKSAGGFSQHGLARALVQGQIAARNAMGKPWPD